MRNPGRLRGYFHCAEKKGYSGVGLYCAREPDRLVEGFGIADIDAEGRYLEAWFGPLSVVSLYLPSGSSSEERLAVKFRFLERTIPRLHELALSGREVVICGDWNIAHQEIDLKNWRSNQKNPGFLPEERAWLSGVFDKLGYVDVFRRLDSPAGAIHLVVEPWPGLGQERGLAHRLPDRHARDRGQSGEGIDLQGEALLRSCTADHRLRL